MEEKFIDIPYIFVSTLTVGRDAFTTCRKLHQRFVYISRNTCSGLTSSIAYEGSEFLWNVKMGPVQVRSRAILLFIHWVLLVGMKVTKNRCSRAHERMDQQARILGLARADLTARKRISAFSKGGKQIRFRQWTRSSCFVLFRFRSSKIKD